MPTDVPAPFGDFDVPPRTDEQKGRDRERNQEQTRLLATELTSLAHAVRRMVATNCSTSWSVGAPVRGRE